LLGNAPDSVDYRQFLLDFGIDLARIFSNVSGSYGTDPVSRNRIPYDLGWGWLVDFGHEFVGKDSLAKVSEAPPNRLVTIVWNKDDVANVYASLFHNDSYEYMEMPRTCGQIVASTVLHDGEPIGCAISRCYSYWSKEMISLAILRVEYAAIGTNVIITWGPDGGPQKLIRGVCTRFVCASCHVTNQKADFSTCAI
jgi:glycine cleavage system aminomethyltransferase T